MMLSAFVIGYSNSEFCKSYVSIPVVFFFRGKNVSILKFDDVEFGIHERNFLRFVLSIELSIKNYPFSCSCWLSMKDGTVWAFIGPVVAIIAVCYHTTNKT